MLRYERSFKKCIILCIHHPCPPIVYQAYVMDLVFTYVDASWEVGRIHDWTTVALNMNMLEDM